MISCSVTSYNISLGLGKHYTDIDPLMFPQIGLFESIGAVFAILAAIYSKTSFALSLLRIGKVHLHVVLWFIILSVNLSLGISALMLWIQCSPFEKNWNHTVPGRCWDPHTSVVYDVLAGGDYQTTSPLVDEFIEILTSIVYSLVRTHGLCPCHYTMENYLGLANKKGRENRCYSCNEHGHLVRQIPLFLTISLSILSLGVFWVDLIITS
jgi:hypothetical protein